MTNRCEVKLQPKLREIEGIVPEEMEARLITAVNEIARCLMSFCKKLAYDYAKVMFISSRLNNRNISPVTMAYQFKVRSDLRL